MVADTPLFVHRAAHRCQFRPAGGFLLLTFSEVSLFAFCRLTNSFPHTHGNNPREREARGQQCLHLSSLLRVEKLRTKTQSLCLHQTTCHAAAEDGGNQVSGEISHLGYYQSRETAQPQIASRTHVHLHRPTASSSVPPARSPPQPSPCHSLLPVLLPAPHAHGGATPHVFNKHLLTL